MSPMPDRLVFFFSGFDPKGANYYHRLQREGAEIRSGLEDGVQVTVGARSKVDPVASACDVTWSDPVAHATTRHHYMRWDDVVRRSWTRTPRQLVSDYAHVYGIGLPGGDFARIWRKSRAAWGMAIFPLVVAVLSLSIAFTLLFAILRADGEFGLAGCLAVAIPGAVLIWRMIVRRIDCEWLLRLYAFTQAQAAGSLPQLETRMDALADFLVRTVEARLDDATAPPLREVMLVGYSTGSTVAASVLARALPRLRPRLAQARAEALARGEPGPALSVLTLGHCLPIAADWAAAHRVREELRQVGDCEEITWHDWSAPADWAAFWRTPPWPDGARLQGVQRSPRFHAQMTEEAYRALRRDRRRMHLQYLRPPMRPVPASGYDWFRLTAGPGTLAASPVADAPPPSPR